MFKLGEFVLQSLQKANYGQFIDALNFYHLIIHLNSYLSV